MVFVISDTVFIYTHPSIRKLNIRRHHDADDRGDNWFWDKEYRHWREHHKQRLLGDIE